METRFVEARVGVLLLGALGAAALLTFTLGDCGGRGRLRLQVDMSHTGGVAEGAPVRVAGVAVGRVRRVELLPARRDEHGGPLPVRFHLGLEESVRPAITEGAQFFVATQGALGEPYLEVEPGPPGGRPLSETDVIRGVPPGRTELIISKLTAILDAAAAALPKDPQVIAELIREITRLAKNADDALEENRGTIARATQDLAAAAADMKALAARAGKLAGDEKSGPMADAAKAAEALPRLVAKAQASADALEKVTAGLTADDGARVRDAIARYDRAGEKVEQVLARADGLLVKMEKSGLFEKPELKSCQDLQAAVGDLKRVMAKLVIKY